MSCAKIMTKEAPGNIKFVSVLAKNAYFVCQMEASDQVFALEIGNFDEFKPVAGISEKIKIKKMVGNNNFLLFLTENGHLYTLNKAKLEKMPKRENIVQIECHSSHFLAL